MKKFRRADDMESNEGHRPDMPEFLTALDKTVALMNQFGTDTPSHKQVDDALTTHINMLVMLRDMKYRNMKLKEQTRTEGEALTNVIQDLLGKDSSVAHYAKELRQSCPRLTEKDIRVEALVHQLQKLESLRHELWLEDKINEIVSREVEILRELPRLFPEGASFRESLEKRTNLLK